MKRFGLAMAAFGFAVSVFAYNPPAGGQNLYGISGPRQLTSASSAAGGGLFFADPGSIVYNPALTAYEDRIQLDFDFSYLGDFDDDSGASFQTGLMVPMKMFVATGLVNGTFISSEDMDLGKSFTVKAGLAKEITSALSVGANLYTGFLLSDGGDWALGADLGVLYRRETFGFAKDFRIGASLLNLGKPFGGTTYGVDWYNKDNEEPTESEFFPALATLRAGAAAVLFEKGDLAGGASFDISAPAFMDLAFDLGMQVSIKDTFFVSVAETIDILEISQKCYNLIPSIGIGVKFNLAANNAYLASHSWENSEMMASLAWKRMYGGINAISGGANLKLGKQDTDPPVIRLWNE